MTNCICCWPRENRSQDPRDQLLLNRTWAHRAAAAAEALVINISGSLMAQSLHDKWGQLAKCDYGREKGFLVIENHSRSNWSVNLNKLDSHCWPHFLRPAPCAEEQWRLPLNSTFTGPRRLDATVPETLMITVSLLAFSWHISLLTLFTWLGTECSDYRPPPKFICWNSKSQCKGIWGRNTKSACFLSLPCEDTVEGWPSTS